MKGAPPDDPRRDPLHTGLTLATFLVMSLLALVLERAGLQWRAATMVAAPLATAFCCAVPFFRHRLPDVRVPHRRRTVLHYAILGATALLGVAFLALGVPWWVVLTAYVLSALAVYVSYQVFAFVLSRRASRTTRPRV